MESPLKAVLEVSLLFAQEHHLDRLLQLVTRKAVEIASAERGCIALTEGGLLTPKAAVGLHPEEGERISNTLAQEVLKDRAPQMWEDLLQDQAVSRARSILRQRLRSAMCAPLLVGGKILGILYVDATTRGHYTSADLTVFQALASQAAMAIENARLFQEVITDPLTGLYSAAVFYRRLNEEIARHRRYGRPLSLILADLIGLNAINAAHGPEAGNRALLALAGILRGNMRSSDVPCRYGGDDFAVILPETGAETATALHREMKEASTMITAKEMPGWQGIAFGTATCPDDGDTAEALLMTADGQVLAGKAARVPRPG